MRARGASGRFRRGAGLGHAARVAAVSTVVIAAVYVGVVAVLDVFVATRLTHQVDQHLADRLREARSQVDVLTGTPEGEREHEVDEAPVFLWRVDAAGRPVALTAGAPTLVRRTWDAAAPTTLVLGKSRLRLDAVALPGGGWLVAGESVAEPAHVRGVLLTSEVVLGPVVLLSVYLGSLAIGVKASAPVELARRRQLEFTADASHELRTPLSVIEAEVGLALRSPRDAAGYRETLERVAGESRRLRRIVEDLLWLARFDSEPPTPGREPIDLAAVAGGSAQRFDAVARSRGIALSVRHEGTVPAWITAPPEWVDRLAGVLVDNACRYAGEGGAVRVVVGAGGARAYLAVEDTGPGIPPSERERLFDRFHRATDEPGGAGLGLAIADSVVRATGGRWRIGDAPGGGARMEVSWHRAAGREREQPGRPAPTPVGG